MRTVYVAERGATVRRDGATLEVWADRKRTAVVAVHDLGQLVLMGNVVLTPPALDLLLDKGVDVVLLGHHGNYRGRIVTGVSGNVRLRLAQYRRLTDPRSVAWLARAIVRGKASNQRTLLLRFARRHGTTPGIDRSELSIRAVLARLDAVGDDLDRIRGCEGACSTAYFRAFRDLVRADGFDFGGRSRRPPMDPLNALLSLGYTLLSNAIEGAVQTVGLDPYLGALHDPQAGRPSLVCDLVEEHRAGLVDALVLAAVNRGAIRPEGFEEVGPGEPVVMKRDTVRTFVSFFERRLLKTAMYDPRGLRLTARQILEAQARLFARHILGEDVYVPLELR